MEDSINEDAKKKDKEKEKKRKKTVHLVYVKIR